MNRTEYLRDKANSLPILPGVYIMKDAEGNIIYVGKSKKLKNRVSSYFVGSSHSIKTAKMTSLVTDFDYIICKSELEALALENVLIKKHSPKYNIKLKDAKSYPYIKVTREPYPRLFVSRERKNDGASYYGPYKSSSDAHRALDAVMRVFSLASCKRSFPRDIGKLRPCLYKEMGRCVAPCDGKFGESAYKELVKRAQRVLSGNVRETREDLRADMERASEELMFERAALLRDSIRALDALVEKQKVLADRGVCRDVFSLYTSELDGVLAVLNIRDGALVNKNEFILSQKDEISEDDIISVIANYYDGAGEPPREIMLGFDLAQDSAELLSQYLSLSASSRVNIKFPERGEGRALCELALENAKENARQYRLEGAREDKDVSRLAELLSVPIPSRIEAFDISNVGDENINASMVVYKDKKLKRSEYRLFSIKTVTQRDDYASMREALTRRLAHIGSEQGSLGERPDLILLDGGKTHVAVGKEVLSSLSLDIPLFGMVKDEFHKTRAITDGEREISIARELNVYAFVYKLQEEAHRFAKKGAMGGKNKSLVRSSLLKIEGIGEKKARALLSELSLSEIKSKGIDELSKIKGISEKDAKSIYDYFHKNQGE